MVISIHLSCIHCIIGMLLTGYVYSSILYLLYYRNAADWLYLFIYPIFTVLRNAADWLYLFIYPIFTVLRNAANWLYLFIYPIFTVL